MVTRQPLSVSSQRYTTHLKTLILPDKLREQLAPVIEHAERTGTRIYLVGGIVRDLLLFPERDDRYDLDLVVEGDAIGFAQGFVATGGKWRDVIEVTAHTAFGTATITLEEGSHLDFATAREERYPEPAQLPVVEPSTLQADLARRDFTINAMAVQLAPGSDDRVIDPYGGADDLDRGVLRVLHPSSFRDDPTRLFRLARFGSRLNFSPDDQTSLLIPEALQYLRLLTPERVRHELDTILKEEHPEHALTTLNQWEVLKSCKQLTFSEQDGQRFGNARILFESVLTGFDESGFDLKSCYWAVWAMTNRDRLSALGLSRRVAQAVQGSEQIEPVYARFRAWSGSGTPIRVSQIVAEFDRLAEGFHPAVLIALAVSDDAETFGVREWVVRWFTVWRYIKPTLNGTDLIRFGLKPGPRFGRLLTDLRGALLDGEVVAGEQEMAFAHHWIALNP